MKIKIGQLNMGSRLCCVVLQAIVLIGLTLATGAGADTGTFTLSLEGAAEAAQFNDPWLVKSQHTQNAVESLSVAAGTLPDPRVSLSLANLPTDTFDFDQEAMTQLKVGVAQMFPRGDTLALKQKQLEIVATQFPFQRQDRKAKVVVMVSSLWLEAYKAQESIALIEQDRPLFEQLADIAEASYSSALGKTRQQDIIRGQLELIRLDDRLTMLSQKKEKVVETLSEWLSENFRHEYMSDQTTGSVSVLWSRLELKRESPNVTMLNEPLYTASLESDPQILYEYFSQHPSVAALEQKIKANDTEIDLAKQKYKPEWGVNASYGYRDEAQNGTDRADFLSVGLTFDVPIFTKKRQDRQVEAAISQAQSVKTEKWLLIRKMIADFEKLRTQLQRLDERQKRYQQDLLPQMHEQAEASLTAYTNDDGDFAEVVRSRIAELNSLIEALNIQVERQKTIIQMNYFFMDSADEIISSNRNTGELK